MVHAFFDDADTWKESGHIFLAGYIADDDGWENFGAGWYAALQRHGLARLHTSDFLSGKGEYNALGWSYDHRLEVLKDFIDIIRQNILCGVAVGVDAKAFAATLANGPKKPSANGFAFERVVRMCVKRLSQMPNGVPFQMVFDDSEEHSMRFYGALRDMKRRRTDIRDSVIGIAFCDDRFVMPLQASDLLACATVREFRRGVTDAWSDGPLTDLLRWKDPAYGLLYDQEYWSASEIEARKDELLIATANTRGALNGRRSKACNSPSDVA